MLMEPKELKLGEWPGAYEPYTAAKQYIFMVKNTCRNHIKFNDSIHNLFLHFLFYLDFFP